MEVDPETAAAQSKVPRDADHEVPDKRDVKEERSDRGSSRGSSLRTTSSRRSSNAAAARAKMEAAKARMLYIEQEAEIKRRRALLQVDLDLLQEKMYFAEIEAEAKAYEQFDDNASVGSHRSLPKQEEDSEARTERYVRSLNADAPPFRPMAEAPRNDSIDTMANFLIKKDLLVSRLPKFDDDPSKYASWKVSFKSVSRELELNVHEEMDLLVNNLGPESRQQGLSIRASNVNSNDSLFKLWERLDERYGSPELIESTLKTKIANFSHMNTHDAKKLYELSDILSEIECLKENPTYSPVLAYFDTAGGVNPILAKLPQFIRHKWIDRASRYKTKNKVTFPPFSFFSNFVKEMCKMCNDPSFNFDSCPNVRGNVKSGQHHNVKKTTFEVSGDEGCPLHYGAPHTLDVCKEFLRKDIAEKRQLLREKGMCYKCCQSSKHVAKDCKNLVKCEQCNSLRHTTAMHVPEYQNDENQSSQRSAESYGGEPVAKVNAKCTTICGEGFSGRSCSKTILVKVYPDGEPQNSVLGYAILDDQSNTTLATSDLLNRMNVSGEEVSYELMSCSGLHQSSGRKVTSLRVQSIDESYEIPLKTVFECNNIPQDRSEIPTPDIAHNFPHLAEIRGDIPPINENAEMCLLIGRDVIDAHQVEKQIVGPNGTPFAQKLRLGWVIIGNVCLGKVHPPTGQNQIRVNVYKTSIIQSTRPSLFEPCQSNITLKEIDKLPNEMDSLFAKSKDDEKISLSQEDRAFLDIMDSGVSKSEGKWIAPLPFRENRQALPNNRPLALKRALTLDRDLKRNPTKRDHFVTFMGKVLNSGAAEVPGPIRKQEVWYLPLFGVYHPHKPDKIRGVFDSSAQFKGVSLNETLLSGPNLTNSLLGILLRFRQNQYAVAADIEQMFYAFLVQDDHRDFLRFYWYRDNDPTNDLIEYRMRAHVFGNSPSPAVATYCLRKSVEKVEVYGKDVKDFVTKDFYVDDGLTSVPSIEEGVSILQKTKSALKEEGSIRLHKIVSNSPEIMNSFSEEDLGSECKSIVLGEEPLPVHQSLGMSWDLNEDCFKLVVNLLDKPETRRGLLSTINSIFDPLGFVAPVTIEGKILMREITRGADWDETLTDSTLHAWRLWKDTLQTLSDLSIPRMFVKSSLSTALETELHIFSDASEKAVSAVAYVKAKHEDQISVGFVMSKSKVAPSHGHTIPRLELCAALLATQICETILENLSVTPQTIKYYTDSKVVLGYLNNKTRRFHTYVSNRVNQILTVSKAEQWQYVPTNKNPADHGTRGLSTVQQLQEKWLAAPDMLLSNQNTENSNERFPLISPELDKEIRVEVFKTTITTNLVDRFERFSDWNRLVSAIALLKTACRIFKRNKESSPIDISKTEMKREVEQMLIQQAQRHSHSEEVQCLLENRPVAKNSSIAKLSPYIDESGIMRVGGRLSCLSKEENNPIILSRKSHLAILITRHFHNKVKHQGRLFTESAIRSNGYWIVGAKRLVAGIIHCCVKCRKLRGVSEQQRMADLPKDRLIPGPPFTSVGVDTFGPWSVMTRKTRGGVAHSKRWAILFTCLTTRAIHIEVIEEMSSSSFINALRRFIALRGNVKSLRSDRGTNFVGATKCLNINAINVEDGPVGKFLDDSRVTWHFNPPHSSHMGGVWERMIGVTRRILDGILQENIGKHLTHEVLVTFMAEVCGIMNSRPLVPLSTDSEDPVVLSPAMLLNQKMNDGDVILTQEVDIRDIYKAHWKQVQVLSNAFWKRWKERYLQSLQQRRKWLTKQRNIENGDVVLIKDKCEPRSEWCVGVVVNAIRSADGLVRKAEVRVYKDKHVTYVRPVTELVLLLEN